MFEVKEAWSVETNIGERTLDELIAANTIDLEIPVRGGTSVINTCSSCPWPGGGGDKWHQAQARLDSTIEELAAFRRDDDAPDIVHQYPDGSEKDLEEAVVNVTAWVDKQKSKPLDFKPTGGESNPCQQSQCERSKCPHVRSTVLDLVCQRGHCNSMTCEPCMSSGREGLLRKGDQVMIQCYAVIDIELPKPDPRDPPDIIHQVMGQRIAGRYMGTDTSGVMRFEQMEVGKGLNGQRLFLHPSGFLLREMNDAQRKAVAPGGKQDKKPIIAIARDLPK